MIGERDEYLERLAVEDCLLLAAVVLLPWAFGGVEVWAYRSSALLIALAAGIAIVRHGPAGLGLGRGALWLAPAFLLVVWAAFQIVPLPPPVVALLSPQADRIYRQSFPGYPSAPPDDLMAAIEADALDRVPEAVEDGPGWTGGPTLEIDDAPRGSAWRPLSLDPYSTQERLFWYLALLLAFLLTLERTRDPIRARIYRTVMFAAFVALGMFALLQAATWNGRIFWFGPKLEFANPFGPYVNFIHFGGLMEIAVVWMAGYTWTKVLRPEGDTLWRSIAPVAAGATALCFAAGLASASKGAAALIVASLVGLGLIGLRGTRARLAFVGAVVLLGAAAVPLVQRTALGERIQIFMASQESALARTAALPPALRVVGDYWLTGVGFGGFASVFPAYVPPGSEERWNQLHNDYVEVVLDGGLVAGVLVLWLVIAFAVRASRSVASSRGRAGPADLESTGLLLGIVALAVHAIFDFNHQIPANALIWVVACAILLGRGEPAAGGLRS